MSEFKETEAAYYLENHQKQLDPEGIEVGVSRQALDEVLMELKGGMNDGCICKGNWRKLVKECEHLIGKEFESKNGKIYIFFGIVHGDDDYYYGMTENTSGFHSGDLQLLSCVGDLEAWGFAEVNDNDSIEGSTNE